MGRTPITTFGDLDTHVLVASSRSHAARAARIRAGIGGDFARFKSGVGAGKAPPSRTAGRRQSSGSSCWHTPWMGIVWLILTGALRPDHGHAVGAADPRARRGEGKAQQGRVGQWRDGVSDGTTKRSRHPPRHWPRSRRCYQTVGGPWAGRAGSWAARGRIGQRGQHDLGYQPQIGIAQEGCGLWQISHGHKMANRQSGWASWPKSPQMSDKSPPAIRNAACAAALSGSST